MPTTPKNDRKNAVTRFCLAMEQHRRTTAGRVRSAKEMLDTFFPRTAEGATDKLFVHIPQEIRGPVISGWGIRGQKSALRDDDDKVRRVVEDALASSDIDENAFEEGLTSEILIDWIPLPEWWTFWRTGRLTGVAIQTALQTARDLALFDDKWFLENVEGRGGKLKGTDTLCDTLSKDQIVSWLRNMHQSGDGTPSGVVGAIGWEVILAKTAQDALLFSLDAFAKKVGLAAPPKPAAVEGLDFPSDMEPPSYDSSVSAASTSAALSEARAQMQSSIDEEKPRR
ncbi:MAG: hypothetical protein KF819_28140 [Labilithrix sp.]|nr:hypothetical protein [Labilithrix sp.]